jgi:tRNA-dihydrouridine synthase
MITLHARHVSATRRRAGDAKIEWVKMIREWRDEIGLKGVVNVLGNGGAESWEQVMKRKEITGVDGWMVGEAVLGNPL